MVNDLIVPSIRYIGKQLDNRIFSILMIQGGNSGWKNKYERL